MVVRAFNPVQVQQDDAGPENHELAPKPLNIFKRIASSNSGRSTSDLFRQSVNQNTSIPRRSSSNSRHTSWFGFHHQNSVNSIAATSSANPSLNVPKQRRRLSASGRPSATKMSLKPSAEQTVQKPTTGHADSAKPLKLPPGVGKASWQLIPTVSRSYSASALHNPPFSNITNQSTASSNQKSSVAQRQRAVTASDILPSSSGPNHSNCGILPLKESLRSRMMSRVMSGFPHKSHAPYDDEDRFTITPPISREHHPEPSENTIRHSDSSANTRPCAGKDLNDTLAAFPDPPGEPFTPETSAPTSFDSSRVRSKQLRDLSQPHNVGILKAELTITPEFDHIIFENGESVFVAMDIKAVAPSTSDQNQKQKPQAALEVVVVIDNS